MKERPILFSAPMVRAILEGRKTQTRRVIKPQPERCELTGFVTTDKRGTRWATGIGFDEAGTRRNFAYRCPYGRPGDRLWVRETFIREPHPSEFGLTREQLPRTWDHACAVAGTYRYAADPGAEIVADGRRWSPSIHMPRAASRITLDVTDVRVERLHDISEADARAEGCPGGHGAIPDYTYSASPIEHYRHLWESINSPGSWDANPWVWVVEFKRAAQAQAKGE